MAADRNMTLEEFNELIMHDASIDHHIDDRLIEIETTEDHYIIDSHLAFHFVPSGFSIFLAISPETSAQSIFNDAHSPMRKKSGEVMQTYQEALLRTQKRITNHIERYNQHYGIDPYHESQYAFTINNELRQPEEVVDLILHAYETWLSA
jgi:cytidylate kinase